MDRVVIQIINQKAYKLLQDLEDLNLISLLKKEDVTSESLSDRYAGKLPKNIASDLQNHIHDSRNEWSSDI
jgi:hypothetical protein